jgi:hypothetical protein
VGHVPPVLVDPTNVIPMLAWTVVPAVLILAYGLRKPSSRHVERWAAARDLRLTEANRTLVAQYLQRTRRLRSMGGVIGLLISSVPGNLLNFLDPSSRLAHTMLRLATGRLSVYLIFGGYLLGALAAEFSLARPGGGRRAALVPREVGQYVNPKVRTALRALAAALVALPPWPGHSPGPGWPQPTLSRYVFTAVAGIGIVALVEGLQRLIVRRPQRVGDPDLLAADDAIRASSAHACAGAGLALLMSLVGEVLMERGAGTHFLLVRWPFMFGGLALTVGAVRVWLRLGTPYAWVVRRRRQEPSPA